jgi:hypothetical protein
MGSDHALYIAVDNELELRRLLPRELDSVVLAPTCRFARIADPDLSWGDLCELAATVSKRGHAALVMMYASVTGDFAYTRFDNGAPVRELEYADGWRIAKGAREPWESVLPAIPVAGDPGVEFDPWIACDAAGAHFRLTGWFESHIEPTARELAQREVMERLVEGFLDTKRQAASRARTIEHWLDGASLGASIARDVLVAHGEWYVLLDDTGLAVTWDRGTCSKHGPEVELLVYPTRASVESYVASWEAPVLNRRASERITSGEAVLALAAERGANVLHFNWLGEGLPGRLHVASLEACSGLGL